jgi:hypothetical protein
MYMRISFSKSYASGTYSKCRYYQLVEKKFNGRTIGQTCISCPHSQAGGKPSGCSCAYWVLPRNLYPP